MATIHCIRLMEMNKDNLTSEFYRADIRCKSLRILFGGSHSDIMSELVSHRIYTTWPFLFQWSRCFYPTLDSDYGDLSSPRNTLLLIKCLS